MKKFFALGLILSCSLPVNAEVLWQDFSVSYLNGSNYRVGDKQRQVLTFEHAAGLSFGDSFFFLDRLHSSNGDRENYAEWSPRLSLSKLSDSSYQFGLVKDVLFSSTVEMSEQQTHYLYGVGLDLAVPGFNYLNLNLLRRNNEQVADNWQLTMVWALPFKLGGQSFVYDGFLDWFNTTADQRASMNLTSQLKWAAHEQFGWKHKVYLGVEYVYWRNKFGIADSPAFHTNESNLNFLLKAHF